MSNTKPTEESSKPKKPTLAPLTSLGEIQKLCAAPKRVEFEFEGRQCALDVRRLTPAEEARIAEIVESVIPPVVKGRTMEEDRLDLTNPAYIKKKSEAALQARAVALYWAVQALQDAKPGLTHPEDIGAFVQGQLTEAILDVLWRATRDTGLTQADLVNFT